MPLPCNQQFFTLDPGVIYLNHAAVSPWPIATLQAVTAFAQENAACGAQHYPAWTKTEAALRANLKQLINAPAADDVALVKNTSEGLSLIAHGLHWQAGDSIVIPAEEFPSNRIVWESLRSQGVTVRTVSIEGQAEPEKTLLAACDKSTRLVSVSTVQYARGVRLHLEQIGAHCRHHDILFCVDGIQGIGAVVTDVEAAQADFIVADGHKWLLAPEGLGLFYCRADVRDRLALHQYGWHMREMMHDHARLDWTVAHSARRFEPGSPNMLGIHALHASTSLLLSVGMANIEAMVLRNSRYLMELIHQRDDLELLTNDKPGRFGGIVTFTHRHISAEKLYKLLMNNNIVCAVRGGGIRFSPHFYNDTTQLEAAIHAIPLQL